MKVIVSWQHLTPPQNGCGDFARRRPAAHSSRCRGTLVRCQLSRTVEPVRQEVTVFAPATVANLGPGFDWLGCAVKVWQNTSGSIAYKGAFKAV